LVLTVRAAPKSSRDAVLGVMETPDGQALKVAVTAPADKGKANAALCSLLAKAFKVSKSSVAVISGDTDRRKVLRVSGDAAKLTPIAQQWIST